MGIQKWSDDIVLVNLAKEPQMGEELQTVVDMAVDNGSFDVVLDFANIDIVTSSSIAKILKLRKALIDCGHKLVLSTVNSQTMSIFTVTALDSVFEFVESQFAALAGLQIVSAG